MVIFLRPLRLPRTLLRMKNTDLHGFSQLTLGRAARLNDKMINFIFHLSIMMVALSRFEHQHQNCETQHSGHFWLG
jgi:hypothetical protein